MRKDLEPKTRIYELMPDMKLYFGEMSKILRYQGYILSLAGMNMGRSVFDMTRELLLTVIDKFGALDDDISIWEDKGNRGEVFSQVAQKLDSGEIIPKSKFPRRYVNLFQDIRTTYCFAEEKIKEKGEDMFSYENGPIGVPVQLTIEMLDKVLDSKKAKKKWDEIKGNKNKISELFTKTKWAIDDL